jgi:hypothetical protein
MAVKVVYGFVEAFQCTEHTIRYFLLPKVVGVQVAKWLQNCLSTSLMHAPAVVIFDDIDALIPVIPEHAPPQEQQHMGLIIEFLANVFDWLREKVLEPCLTSCVACIATAPVATAPAIVSV